MPYMAIYLCLCAYVSVCHGYRSYPGLLSYPIESSGAYSTPSYPILSSRGALESQYRSNTCPLLSFPILIIISPSQQQQHNNENNNNHNNIIKFFQVGSQGFPLQRRRTFLAEESELSALVTKCIEEREQEVFTLQIEAETVHQRCVRLYYIFAYIAYYILSYRLFG